MGSDSFDAGPDMAVLSAAPARIGPLLADPKTFASKYEEVFREIRKAAIHMRNYPNDLAGLDQEATRAIATFLLRIPGGFLSGRRDEVATIILGSERWHECQRTNSAEPSTSPRVSLSSEERRSGRSGTAPQQESTELTNITSCPSRSSVDSTGTIVMDDRLPQNVDTFVGAGNQGTQHPDTSRPESWDTSSMASTTSRNPLQRVINRGKNARGANEDEPYHFGDFTRGWRVKLLGK